MTVARIAAGLGARGLDVPVWQAGVEAPEHLMREHPNPIHAFHAYHSGPEASALAKACGAALVVTLTGTDVSEHLAHPSTARAARNVLRGAAAVTGFHESVLAAVLYRGAGGFSGELGHVPVKLDGRACICGARGCVKAYVAGSDLAEEASRRLERSPRRSSLSSTSTWTPASAAAPPWSPTIT